MKKQIFSLLISLGFLCSFFVVQAAGELSPVQPGRGYLFDGVDDYIQLDSFITLPGEFDIRMEVSNSNAAVTDMVLGNSTNYIKFGILNGKIFARLFDGGGSDNTIDFSTDGDIHYIRFTRNSGNKVDVYIDNGPANRLFSDVAQVGSFVFDRIGTDNQRAQDWGGKIGDIQVRDGNGKLLHSWHLDEGSGTTSFDSVREWKGLELVTNGGFDADSDWVLEANWLIADGVATHSTTGSERIRTTDNILEYGKRYFVEFDVTDYVSGTVGVYGDSGSGETYNYIGESVGHFSIEVLNRTQTKLYFRSNDFIGSIDNISIKELHSPSHGTITNATESTFHTTDTDFKSYQNDVGYSEETPMDMELVTNGGFDTDTNWTKVGEAEVGNGGGRIYSSAGVKSALQQNILEAGKSYLLEYTIVENNGGTLNLDSATSYLSIDSTVGTHSITINPTGSTLSFNRHTGITDIRIDNVSVQELTPDGQLIPVALDQNSNPTTKDIYGNDATYTGRTRTKAELVGKNVAVFDGVNDLIDTGSDFIGTKEITITGWVNLSSWGESTFSYILTNGKTILWVREPNGNLGFVSDGASSGPTCGINSISLNKWQFISVTKSSSGITNFYIGDKNISPTLSGTANQIGGVPIVGTTNVIIGNNSASSRTFDGKISNLQIYEGIATEDQITDVWEGKDISLQEITAYPLSEGAGTTVYDTVPTYYGEDLVIGSCTNSSALPYTTFTNASKYGFTATSDGTTSTYAGTPIFSLVSDEKYLVEFDADISSVASPAIVFRSGGVTGSSISNLVLAVDGKNSFILTPTSTTNGVLSIYRTNEILNFTISNLTVKRIHEPANGTVTNADLDIFWATDMDAEDQNLVNGYTPGLINTTAGTAYKENKQAYGTWEFDVNKGEDGNQIYFPFLSDSIGWTTINGYYLVFTPSETVHLYRRNGASATVLFITADSYISNDTWYRIKIQRNQTLNQYHTGAIGSFAVYIKGGDFGDDYVLVTPASGTNPVVDDTYTTSEYSVVDLDAGDQVAGFMENNKIVDFHSFTEGTGEYDKLSLPAQSGRTAKDINNDRLTYMPQNLRYSAMAYKNVGVFDGVDDYVEIPMSSAIQPETYLTLEAWVNPNVSYVGDIILLGQSGYYLTIGSDWSARVYWYGKTPAGYHSSGANTVPAGKWTHVVAAWNESSVKIYINGALKNTIVSTGVGSSPVNQLWIGTEYAGATRQFHGSISDVRIYNRALSATDIEKLYQGETINNNGLVAHYPLSEGAGMTAYNAASTWYGSNRITDGNGNWGDTDGNGLGEAWMTHRPANQFSILTDSYGRYQHVVKNTENLCSLAQSNVVQTEGGRTYKLTLKYRSDSNISDGTSGYNHDIIPFSTTPVTVERIISGGTGGLTSLNFFSGGTYMDIYSVKLQEIHEPTNGTITNTTPATFWKIDNTAPVSQSYTNGFSQGLVNTTAGTAYTPSDVAYGEWEFDLYKKGDANELIIHLTETTSDLTGNGYYLDLSATERIQLLKFTGGGYGSTLFQTGVSYIVNNTWYRIKMTRSSAGVFTVYIKGGEFGDEYVLVVPETGTNPVTDNTYTTSNYFVTDLDAGDQIANVQIDGHRASVHEFELGTGTYDKLFIPSQTGRGMDVLESVKQIMGTTANSVFTSADLVIIAAQKLAREGINYWDVTTRKFFTGQSDGSLSDFVPNTERVKTTSELATINTNKTADVDHNYWDTTLRKFLRGLADGTLQDFMTWYAER